MRKELIINYRKILPGIMIGLALLISGVGMVGSVEPGDSTRGSGTVSGYVYDNENGEILSDVEIDLYNEETDHGYQDYSDEDGYYEFDDLESGEYRIRSYDNRYYAYEDYFSISEGENLQNDIHLDPYECTVFGYVYDIDTDEPINGSRVYLWFEEDGYHSYRLDITGDEGDYNFFMSPGEYEIEVNSDGYIVSSREIEIEEGEELQEDFYLEALCSISGIVYDGETLEPLPDLEVDLYNNGYWVDYDYTDENGEYEVHMVPGEYTLYVRGGDRHKNFEKDFDIDEDEHIIYDIYLEPDLTKITGYVYDLSSGEPIEDASVEVANYDTWDWNYDYTDENGYYEVYPGVGECSISVTKE